MENGQAQGQIRLQRRGGLDAACRRYRPDGRCKERSKLGDLQPVLRYLEERGLNDRRSALAFALWLPAVRTESMLLSPGRDRSVHSPPGRDRFLHRFLLGRIRTGTYRDL